MGKYATIAARYSVARYGCPDVLGGKYALAQQAAHGTRRERAAAHDESLETKQKTAPDSPKPRDEKQGRLGADIPPVVTLERALKQQMCVEPNSTPRSPAGSPAQGRKQDADTGAAPAESTSPHSLHRGTETSVGEGQGGAGSAAGAHKSPASQSGGSPTGDRERSSLGTTLARQATHVRLEKRKELQADHEELLKIMARSNNAFVQLLSTHEQKMLTEGRGPDGAPNCRFKTFEESDVIVEQGDEGHSMFIVIQGQLRVLVTFVAGFIKQQKEVAVLPAGSVMGEMSLVRLVCACARSCACVCARAHVRLCAHACDGINEPGSGVRVLVRGLCVSCV